MTSCPQFPRIRRFLARAVVLAALAAFVHLLFVPGQAEKVAAQNGPGAKESKPIAGPPVRNFAQPGMMKIGKITVGRDMTQLPQPVAHMRDAILEAVRRGDIAELKYAIDLNELKPDFGAIGDDPIAGFKAASTDGKGLSILAVLGEILDAPYAIVHAGADIENNKLYVWPYLAEIPAGSLSAAQDIELYRLMDHKMVQVVKKAKTWPWWRIVIGADGVWHSFTRSDNSAAN